MATWPNQYLDLRGHVPAGANPELQRMHHGILAQTGQTAFTTRAPVWYDDPFPGPAEYLANFPRHSLVLLRDPGFCFFLPLWVRHVDLILAVIPDTEITVGNLHRSLRGRASLDGCQRVVHHYEERLRQNMDGLPHVVRLDP